MSTAGVLRCSGCGKTREEGKPTNWFFLLSPARADWGGPVSQTEGACSVLCLQTIVTRMAAEIANQDPCIYDDHAGVWTGPADCPVHGKRAGTGGAP